MAKAKKIPKLRFGDFLDDWKENELSNLAMIKTGYPFSSSDFDQNGKYLIITNGNIQNDLSYIDSSIGNRIDIGNNDKLKEYVLNPGDILITMDGTVGRTAKAKEQNQILAQRVGKLIAQYEPEFLYQLLNTGDFSREMELISHGGTIKHISLAEIANYRSFIPVSQKEQLIIGNFFNNFDTLIATHQRKHIKLLETKRAMLEKMFPIEGADVPEIRFKGFTGKWERKKIGDILTEEKRHIELEDNKQYELVTVRRRNEGIISRGMLYGRDILVKNYSEVKAGDYLISKRQIVHGANGIVPQELDRAIVSNEYLVVIGNDIITTDFWALSSKLPIMYKMFFLSSYGVDIEKLVFDIDDWKKRIISVPDLAEQTKITLYFGHLDSLISLHQRELDKLKNIKKACLEKMFI
jgi:type I restriction enzyme S subunit